MAVVLECPRHVEDSAIVVDLVIAVAAVVDAVVMIVADSEVVVDAADEAATMILLDFADVVAVVVLTVDVVVSTVDVVVVVDVVEAAIVADLGIVEDSAVVEAVVWIVADVVDLIAVVVADPIAVVVADPIGVVMADPIGVASADVVDSTMIVAVDLAEADMDHMMVDMDTSRPDMGPPTMEDSIRMIEQTNKHMILIISLMNLNHVAIVTKCHMTRVHMVKNLLPMTDINLVDTAKISPVDTDGNKNMGRVAMDNKADMGPMALGRHHRHLHLNGLNGKFDK